MKCHLYDDLRNNLFEELSNIIETDNLSPDSLFVSLMSVKDYDLASIAVNFISKAYTVRCNVK